MKTRLQLLGYVCGLALFLNGCGGDGQATVDVPKLMPVEEGPDSAEGSVAPAAQIPLAEEPLVVHRDDEPAPDDDDTLVIEADDSTTPAPVAEQPPTKEELKAGVLEELQRAFAAGDNEKVLALAKQAYESDNDDVQFRQLYVRLLVNNDKPVVAANVLEDSLEKNPDDLQSAIMLVQIYSMVAEKSSDDAETLATMDKAGKLVRSLQEGDGAAALGPQAAMFFSQVLFDEARVYSELKQEDKSLVSLRDAFEAGFTGLSALAEEEAFEELRENEDYQTLVAEYTEKVKLKLREESRQELAEQEEIEFAFELPTLGGEPLKSSDLAGKIVLVDFWGTWCPPCRKVIPHLIALLKKYENDIAVVGLTYPRGPVDLDTEHVKEFVATNEISYPCLIGDDKALADVSIEGFPTLVFMDRAGKVRLKSVGYHSYEKIESVLAELLGEKAELLEEEAELLEEKAS